MYQVGDQVLYGIHGICRILDLENKTVDRKQTQYYVLEPVKKTGARFYVPTQNQAAVAKLRKLLTQEELKVLMESPQIRQTQWIADENHRKQAYRSLINGGDRSALLGMMYVLYRHKRTQLEAGKKFHLCDENFLGDAQRLICTEFSTVLGLSEEQTLEYIKSELNI